jgi:hypothetical protein
VFEKQDGESRTGSRVGMRRHHRLLLDRPAVPNHPTTRPFLSHLMSINIKRPIRKQKYVREYPRGCDQRNCMRNYHQGAVEQALLPQPLPRAETAAHAIGRRVERVADHSSCSLCSNYSTPSLSTHVHRRHANHQGEDPSSTLVQDGGKWPITG